jgi:hypothetical protein
MYVDHIYKSINLCLWNETYISSCLNRLVFESVSRFSSFYLLRDFSLIFFFSIRSIRYCSSYYKCYGLESMDRVLNLFPLLMEIWENPYHVVFRYHGFMGILNAENFAAACKLLHVDGIFIYCVSVNFWIYYYL